MVYFTGKDGAKHKSLLPSCTDIPTTFPDNAKYIAHKLKCSNGSCAALMQSSQRDRRFDQAAAAVLL
uniref:Uncharacterized protein n=1 Tax=Ascaris lumbricoides TaxID=6252 RepID=A0A0M3I0V9_ASCLU